MQLLLYQSGNGSEVMGKGKGKGKDGTRKSLTLIKNMVDMRAIIFLHYYVWLCILLL